MARYEGKRSAYELSNIKFNLVISLVYLFLLFILIILLWALSIINIFNQQYFWIIIGLFGIALFLLHFIFPWLSRDFYCFVKGLRAEDRIRFELLYLPNNYTVYEDVKIPGIQSNIDFIVIGPKGILTIEVKSHRGNIGFDRQQLTHNGKRFMEKDILEQTLHEEMNLHNYLLDQFKVGISITPILVFANRVNIHFGLTPINNVVVVGRSYLLKYIYSKSVYNYPVPREVIEEKLKLLTS